MRRFITIAWGTVLAGACAHTPPNSRPARAPLGGGYLFQELNTATQFPLSGRVIFNSGDATLEINRSLCRGVHAVTEGSHLVFSCAGEISTSGRIVSHVIVDIDQQDPDGGSSWSGSMAGLGTLVGGRLHVTPLDPSA